jgi:carboxyl-terminal processing protease
MGSLTKKNLWIAAGYSSVLIVGLILGQKFASENQNAKNGSFLSFGLSDRSSKVEKIIRIINENYVDSVQMDTVQGPGHTGNTEKPGPSFCLSCP